MAPVRQKSRATKAQQSEQNDKPLTPAQQKLIKRRQAQWQMQLRFEKNRQLPSNPGDLEFVAPRETLTLKRRALFPIDVSPVEKRKKVATVSESKAPTSLHDDSGSEDEPQRWVEQSQPAAEGVSHTNEESPEYEPQRWIEKSQPVAVGISQTNEESTEVQLPKTPMKPRQTPCQRKTNGQARLRVSNKANRGSKNLEDSAEVPEESEEPAESQALIQLGHIEEPSPNVKDKEPQHPLGVMKKLPVEIRLMILRYFLIAEDEIPLFNNWGLVYPRTKPRLDLAIMYTCKDLYQHSIQILYGENKFVDEIRDPDKGRARTSLVLKKFFSAFPIERMGHLMRYIKVKLDWNRVSDQRRNFEQAVLMFAPGGGLDGVAKLHTLTLEVPAVSRLCKEMPGFENNPDHIPTFDLLKRGSAVNKALHQIDVQYVKIVAIDSTAAGSWETTIDLRSAAKNKQDDDGSRDIEAIEERRAREIKKSLAAVDIVAHQIVGLTMEIIKKLAEAKDLTRAEYLAEAEAIAKAQGHFTFCPLKEPDIKFESLPNDFSDRQLASMIRANKKAAKPQNDASTNSVTVRNGDPGSEARPSPKRKRKAGLKNRSRATMAKKQTVAGAPPQDDQLFESQTVAAELSNATSTGDSETDQSEPVLAGNNTQTELSNPSASTDIQENQDDVPGDDEDAWISVGEQTPSPQDPSETASETQANRLSTEARISDDVDQAVAESFRKLMLRFSLGAPPLDLRRRRH
ncbi:hypothetical protein F5Y16DRAFT_211856 [Xylariaceae sp. FL0255]|nr:hypothetical protein F5Y16DRAFT_211856 [Xylariaceae sp. FL0255]